MSVVCPNGHQSETTDYCDQCGARIAGASSPAPTPGLAGASSPARPDPAAAPPGPPDPAPASASTPVPAVAVGSSGGDELCPVCQTPRVGDDRFCEGCGYDYTTPAPVAGPAEPLLAAVAGTTTASGWEAVAVADRDYYDRVAPEGVPFPLHYPTRTFLLAGDQISIGRHSNSRGIQPEVDLSGAPEDGAISHLHCLLVQQPDGSYALVDPGSTNGTTLNDDPTPLMANISVGLADGDRIHLGAWTTVTIRARRHAPTSPAAP